MKYQKSILKIYEMLVKNPLKEFIIEEIIKSAKVGRTAGFEAIKWLEKNALIKVETAGKQKSVTLLVNETALNFKFFLDSFELKNLSRDALFQINLFVYLASRHSVYAHINAVLLSGSAVYSKKPNDIDLYIVCRNLPEDQEELKRIRKLTENICDILINLHFTSEKDIYNLLQKLMIHNQSYSTSLLKEIDKSLRLKLQYTEALYDISSMINNLNNDELLPHLFYRWLINLAYCDNWLENKVNIGKEEAIELFENRYINKIKNFEKLGNINKFEIFKRITNEIGQKIFI